MLDPRAGGPDGPARRAAGRHPRDRPVPHRPARIRHRHPGRSGGGRDGGALRGLVLRGAGQGAGPVARGGRSAAARCRCRRHKLAARPARASTWTLFSPDRRSEHAFEDFGLNGEPKVLYVGRLSREKGLDALIDGFEPAGRGAAGRPPGDGGRRPLRRRAGPPGQRRRPRHVHRRADGRAAGLAVYASSDVFVSPSETETFGNTWSRPRPPACRWWWPAAGPRARTSSRTSPAWWSTPASPRRSAPPCYRLLSQPELRRQMGGEAWRFARRYDLAAAVRETFAIYAQLARLPDPPRRSRPPAHAVDVRCASSTSPASSRTAAAGIKTYYQAKARYLPALGVDCHFVVPGARRSEEGFEAAVLHRLPGPRLPGNPQLPPVRAAARGDRSGGPPGARRDRGGQPLPAARGDRAAAAGRLPGGARGWWDSSTATSPARWWRRWLRRLPARLRPAADGGRLALGATAAPALRRHAGGLATRAGRAGAPGAAAASAGWAWASTPSVFQPRRRRRRAPGRPPADGGLRRAGCRRTRTSACCWRPGTASTARTGARLRVLGEGPARHGLVMRFAASRPHRHGRRLPGRSRGRWPRCWPAPTPSSPRAARETFSLSTAEALACGTPVVAPAAGGAGELVSRLGRRPVFRPDDPAALAERRGRPAGAARRRARARWARAAGPTSAAHHTWPAVMPAVAGRVPGSRRAASEGGWREPAGVPARRGPAAPGGLPRQRERPATAGAWIAPRCWWSPTSTAGHPLAGSPETVRWLRERVAAGDEVALHGFFHRQRGPIAGRFDRLRAALFDRRRGRVPGPDRRPRARRLLADGQAAAGGAAGHAGRRLRGARLAGAGRIRRPLAAAGFGWHEGALWVASSTGPGADPAHRVWRRRRCPVIGFATRTRPRLLASLAWARLLAPGWRTAARLGRLPRAGGAAPRRRRQPGRPAPAAERWCGGSASSWPPDLHGALLAPAP